MNHESIIRRDVRPALSGVPLVLLGTYITQYGLRRPPPVIQLVAAQGGSSVVLSAKRLIAVRVAPELRHHVH